MYWLTVGNIVCSYRCYCAGHTPYHSIYSLYEKHMKNSFQVSVVLQCTLWYLESPQYVCTNGPITTAVCKLALPEPDMIRLM